MDKPHAQSEPQKAPYVTPKIITLKVEDIIDLLTQLTVPAKAEAPHKANKAAAGGGNPLPPGP
jgi:hypothetical protein